MKTFVIQLDNSATFPNEEPFQGSLGHYKSVTIRIKSPEDRQNCYLLVKFTEDIIISLIDKQFKYSDISLDNAKAGSLVDSASLDRDTEYYIYIPGVVDHDLFIPDITSLDTFNASFYTGESVHVFEGLDIEAEELMKLSTVRDLRLRYSVRHPHYFNCDNFIYFTKLQSLFIGSPGENNLDNKNMFETICLPDGVMRSLLYLNWEVNTLPKNFYMLTRCTHIYLQTHSSWRNIDSGNFLTPLVYCSYIQIVNHNIEDTQKIDDFLDVYCDNNTYKDLDLPAE